MTAAFCRTLLVLVLGVLLTSDARQELVRTPTPRKLSADGCLSRVACCESGLHCNAIADWHRGTSFNVRGADTRHMPRSGVRPGDPVADLIVNSCMVVFLNEQLSQHDLIVRVTNTVGDPGWAIDGPRVAGP